MADGKVGMTGDLGIEHIPERRAFALDVPYKKVRLIITDAEHEAGAVGRFFQTQLEAHHFRPHKDGNHDPLGTGEPHKLIDHYHLGSGLTTNVFAQALANDFAWAQNAQTLKLANYHASGIGTTAAAATDIALQSLAAPTTTTAVAGVQSLVSAANSQTYKTVATITYATGGNLAITEWGLHSAAALSATTGTPLTAATATLATATGTPYTASSGTVQGQQQTVIRTGTTTVYGLVLSNSTSALTIPAWYTVAGGLAGSTPGATEAFTLIPVLIDHKVFAAINVVNTDTVQYTYSLLCQSGG